MGLDGFSLAARVARPGDGAAEAEATMPARAPDPDAAAAGLPPDADPATLVRHGAILAGLGLVYLRHNDAPRAMVLGLAAMAMGHLTAPAVLLVAEAMVVAGDPAQAAAVLSRFDREGGLSAPPTPTEQAARHYLAARILLREGDAEAARAELARARRIRAGTGTGARAGAGPTDDGGLR